jgi:hypothetical protein
VANGTRANGPIDGSPVDASADLFKAIWPDDRDDTGAPTSEPFRRNNSYDVSLLCTVGETGLRFPGSFVAVIACQFFLGEGLVPLHAPEPENIAHAIVPGRLTKTQARKAKLAVSALYPPVNPH